MIIYQTLVSLLILVQNCRKVKKVAYPSLIEYCSLAYQQKGEIKERREVKQAMMA